MALSEFGAVKTLGLKRLPEVESFLSSKSEKVKELSWDLKCSRLAEALRKPIVDDTETVGLPILSVPRLVVCT